MHTTRSDHIDIPIPSLIMYTISARLVCSETAYMSASPWHGGRAQWVKSKSEYLVHSERSLQETKQPIRTPATLVMVSPHSTASFLQQLLLGISDYRELRYSKGKEELRLCLGIKYKHIFAWLTWSLTVMVTLTSYFSPRENILNCS